MPLPQPSPQPRQEALLALGTTLHQRGYRFTTCTPATHQRVNARPGSGLAHDLVGIFGWSRPFAPAACEPVILAQMHAAEVLTRDGDRLRSILRASTLDGHIYLHSAYPTTSTDAVFFGPDTYRFVRALGSCTRAVDIGCGAGPGAITIALAHPTAQVFAADINPAALRLTDINAQLAGVANLLAVQSDLLGELEGDFDLIVSNPPYLLDRDERAYRHGGGPLGTGLSSAIVQEAITRLAPGGTLLLYTGVPIIDNNDAFQASIEPLLRAAHFSWTYEEIDPDIFGEELEAPAYARAERIAAVWLRATKPGR